MLNRNEVKYIQNLYQKKFRTSENCFVVEGPKLVDELLNSSWTIKKLYATADWEPTTHSPTIQIIEQHELERISALETPNQVLAIVEMKDQQEFSIDKNEWVLVLNGIQDPGNLGTIIRNADWFGVKKIVADKVTADCYNSKVVQSTMGSIFRVNILYTDVASFLKKHAHLPIFGALLDGKDIRTVQAKGGLLIIGNESKGILPDIQPYITDPVTIIRKGAAESLNAGVATGILLSHLTQ